MSTRVITPVAVLSYPHLDKPQAGMNGQGEPKYSSTFVFDKTAQASPQYKAMQEAAIEAAKDKFGPTITAGGKKITIEQAFAIKVLKSPFRDDGEAKGYGEGAVFINTRTADQPQMIRGDKSRIEGAAVREELYPGAKVRASVTAFGYDNSGNKGVSFALNNIQKVSDGDRLDTRKSADEDFDALDVAPEDLEKLGL